MRRSLEELSRLVKPTRPQRDFEMNHTLWNILF